MDTMRSAAIDAAMGLAHARSAINRTAWRPMVGHANHHRAGTPRIPPRMIACKASTSEIQQQSTVGTQTIEPQAVLFDMDGVLVNSEDVSREVAAKVMKQLYDLDVAPEEFIPFMGTGEANFLGGVARKYGKPFDAEEAKRLFFELYLQIATPGSLGYPGAVALVQACRDAGLKVAVASSADMVKVNANLRAAGLEDVPFDAVVAADAFERLKPAPDIFLEASRRLKVPPEACVVIEDAAAGVQAARAAGMRCIGVTTTLDERTMQQEAPVLVRASIADIRLSDIQTLPLARNTLPAAARTQGQALTSVMEGLDAVVQLPGGYRTTRRDVLKLGTLGLGGTALYVALSRSQRDSAFRSWLRRLYLPWLLQLGIFVYVGVSWRRWKEAMSYVSWQSVRNLLLPPAAPPAAETIPTREQRVAAFARYIRSLESRSGGVQVPPFPAGEPWLNAPPLSWGRELKGKVVVLDFWTYCCINCMHILPDLAYLESRYRDRPVTVVGVHSAKFDNEKDDDAIRNAVIRYEIEHPVVNDRAMSMWRALGVSSWPTVVVVGATGRVLATLAGEGHRNDLDELIEAALTVYGEAGQLDDTPVPEALERNKDPRLAASPLRYPGKLAVDGAGDRLYIADSNNHRIVVTDLKGRFVSQVGGNGPLLQDGSPDRAAFNRPQGLALDAARKALYVADTENHAVRKIDLVTNSVTTLAGTGYKGQGDYIGGKAGRAQPLNSPWDVALAPGGDVLYVAIAGQHQLWTIDLATNVAGVWSGDGYERNQNGPSGFQTSWAQPSGLTVAGSLMFVADSESSTVRSVDLASAASRPHVGGDPLFSDNLFRFGDVDGVGSNALLQHPLAVAALPDGRVAVADSYNHKVKVMDPVRNAITTLAGSGRAGFADGPGTAASFSEPGGLAVDGTSLYVADTNNNVVRVVALATGAVSTLALKNVPPPRVAPGAAIRDPLLLALAPPEGVPLVVAEPLASRSGAVRVRLELPAGYHYTEGAGSRIEAAVVGPGQEGVTVTPARLALEEGVVPSFTVAGSGGGSAVVRLLATVYFCRDNDVCLYQQVCFDVPLGGASGSAQEAVELGYVLSAKAVTVAI